MGVSRQPISLQSEVCVYMGSLLNAGFTVKDALSFLAVRWPRKAAMFDTMVRTVSDGAELGDALKDAGFAPVVCTQVALAGAHGDLAGTLANIANYLRLLQRTRGRLVQLLMYPVVLLILLGLLEVGIVYWVLPQVTRSQPRIPWPQIVVGLALLAVVAMVVWLVHVLDSSGRYRLMRHWPLVGPMMRRYYQYEFTVGAGTFLRGGQDIAGYCHYLGQMSAGPLTTLGKRVEAKLADGESLTIALNEPLVPVGVVRLLALGQSQGEFAQTVATYALGLFTDLQSRMNKMLAWVQPLLFVIIGVQIVLMYVGMLLPLYSNIGGEY